MPVWKQVGAAEVNTSPLLEVSGFSLYRLRSGERRQVLADVNFTVKRGQFVALVGRSGIGKTLIMKSILGLLDPDVWEMEGEIAFYRKGPVLCPFTGEQRSNEQAVSSGAEVVGGGCCQVCTSQNADRFPTMWKERTGGSGMAVSCPFESGNYSLVTPAKIVENGRCDHALLSKLLGSEILSVFQGADTHLNPRLRIGWQIGELINLRRPQEDTGHEIKRRLAQVNLESSRRRSYPHQLSQGQMQRAMIAMALGGANLILCDEPTSALDEAAKQKVVDTLNQLRQRGEIGSLLLITHDRGVIDRLIQSHDNVYEADCRDDGAVTLESLAPEPSSLSLGWASAKTIHEVVAERPLLKEPDYGWFRTPYAGSSNQQDILSIENLYQGYRTGIWGRVTWRLKNISLRIREREFFGIVGASGSGKTTLAKSITRLLGNTRGKIWYRRTVAEVSLDESAPSRYVDLVQIQPNGGRADSAKMRSLRREIQMVFQNSASIFNPAMTIREHFLETMELMGLRDSTDPLERVAEAFIQLGVCEDRELESVLSKFPLALSGGERQRLAFARAFLLNPRLVVADEPFAEQDRISEGEIIRMMSKMRRIHGTAFVVISHDLKLMRMLCDRVAIMKDGRIPEVPEELGAAERLV